MLLRHIAAMELLFTAAVEMLVARMEMPGTDGRYSTHDRRPGSGGSPWASAGHTQLFPSINSSPTHIDSSSRPPPPG